MFERERQDRSLLGVRKLKRFLLDLGRKLVAQDVPAEPWKAPAVFIEFSKDFAELTPPCSFGCRSSGQTENAAVIEPIQIGHRPRSRASGTAMRSLGLADCAVELS